MKKSQAIKDALEVLSLPLMITASELKEHYHFLAMKMHPDLGGNTDNMAKINEAYAIIKTYMEEFKFTFSEDEMNQQFPEELYEKRFRF